MQKIEGIIVVAGVAPVGHVPGKAVPDLADHSVDNDLRSRVAPIDGAAAVRLPYLSTMQRSAPYSSGVACGSKRA
jgi:hypothetical protein